MPKLSSGVEQGRDARGRFVSGKETILKLGINTSAYDNGLLLAHERVKSLQSQMRAIQFPNGISGKFSSGIQDATKQVRNLTFALKDAGQALIGAGLTGAIPLGFGVKAFAGFEQSLANIRASANPTADAMGNIKTKLIEISASTGQGLNDVATVFDELSKAGQPAEAALSGMTEEVIKFSKVGKIDFGTAATTITDTFGAFKNEALTASQSANIISRAADSSSISIAQFVESLRPSAAVASGADQSFQSLATAIGLLAGAGLKGSDAGTSLKTFFSALAAPSETAEKAMKKVGLSVRDAAGNVLPLREIIGKLQEKLGGLGKADKASTLKDIFGSDAIRAANILIGEGVKGFDEFTAAQAKSLSVSEKYAIIQNTLKGRFTAFGAAIERAAVQLGDALAPAFKEITDVGIRLADGLGKLAKANPELIVSFAKGVAVVGALGVGLVAASYGVGLVGSALKVASFGISAASTAFGVLRAAAVTANAAVIAVSSISTYASALSGIAGAATLLLNPVTLAGIGIVALGGYALYASGALDESFSAIGKAAKSVGDDFVSMKDFAVSTFDGIKDALYAGDISLAGEILITSLKVSFLEGRLYISNIWHGMTEGLVHAFEGFQLSCYNAINSIKQFFVIGFAGIADFFDGVISKMTQGIISFSGLLRKALSPLTGETFKGIDASTKTTSEKASGVFLDRRLAREKTVTNLQEERKSVNAGAANLFGQGDNVADQARKAAQLPLQEALEALKITRNSQLGKARFSNIKAEFEKIRNEGSDAVGKKKKEDLNTPELPSAGSLQRKFEALVTFSGTRSGNIGIGSQASQLDQMTKAAQQTADYTKKNYELNLKNGGLGLA